MEWNYESVERARDAVGILLEQLGLDTYLFGVEPRNGSWEIYLEYEGDAGWTTRVLRVDSATLVASFSEPGARSKLLQSWSLALTNAKRAARARAPL